MECANAIAFVGDPLYCALYLGYPPLYTRLLALDLASQQPAALQDDETGTVVEIFNHDHDLCIPTIMINP
ncbi:hypothetical protein MVES_002389 [Malassezia vespertilionis]|uniref:Uncharacterized protein n=1 Tax=Malassezia vespertilionis TaxID=2020962 RepID=A0A2N1JAG4_9BASI|nr:hypothetical protein MVES_002389 [Malassezia vespertilionis]